MNSLESNIIENLFLFFRENDYKRIKHGKFLKRLIKSSFKKENNITHEHFFKIGFIIRDIIDEHPKFTDTKENRILTFLDIDDITKGLLQAFYKKIKK